MVEAASTRPDGQAAAGLRPTGPLAMPAAGTAHVRADPGWLTPAVAATVVGLGLLTVVTMLVDHGSMPMHVSHLVGVPVAVGIFIAMWVADLAGLRIPRPLFGLAVALPNAVLAALMHSGPNFLFLLLLVAWIVYTGTRTDGLVALGLSLAPIATAAAAEFATFGRVFLTGWISWTVAILAIWAMARLLVAQQQLVAELRQTQADLRRQAEENARLYEQARQVAALEERQRLARELHDSATQSMYSARMYTEAALRLLAKGDTTTAADYLNEVKDSARDALAEMRLLIYELRPPVLEEQGLAAALRLRLEAVEGRSGLAAEFIADPEPPDDRLPIAMEQELYRVAQEALNNALRHARPGRIRVRLRQTASHVSIEIEDDGVGFDPSSASTHEQAGVGLRGMRERVARLDGTLAIDSTPGQGTRVRVEIPR